MTAANQSLAAGASSRERPKRGAVWTKPVVRWYPLLLTAVLLSAIAASLLVLAGGLADAGWLRVLLLLAAAMALATLMVRIGAGVLAATR